MILMGKRSPEQGKDAVTQGLRHIALVPMHGVHHELQGGIDNSARFFWVESFDESGRTFEVSKEGRDRLAFALGPPTCLQRRLLSANALGEMRRRIARRGVRG